MREEPDEPVVELTEEENALVHRSTPIPDLTEQVIARTYADFTLPSKDEGFDKISFLWSPEDEAEKTLKEWIFKRKLTQRVDDLQPGHWFKDQWSKWSKSLQEWRRRQNEYKDPNKRKILLAKKEEQRKKDAEDGAAPAPLPVINMEDLDVFTVEDVCDVGTGEPLFADFVYEDWTLLSARFEFHLLLHAFRKDLNDPDRPSFKEEHSIFYYNKYFNKPFDLKHYGIGELKGFVDLIRDTISINDETSFLETAHKEDTELAYFVKLAEEHRRERQRRLDAGDETAAIKFSRQAAPPPRQPPPMSQTASRTPMPSKYSSGSSAKPGYIVPTTTYNANKRPYTGTTHASAKHPRIGGYGTYSSSYHQHR